jgi:hypothetical protein
MFIIGPKEEDEKNWQHWGSKASDESMRVFSILTSFFWDWTAGNTWQPTPDFVWDHLGRDLTENEVNDMMSAIEEEMKTELKPHSRFNDWGYAIVFPFSQLEPDEKRALAQRIVLAFDPFETEPDVKEHWWL